MKRLSLELRITGGFVLAFALLLLAGGQMYRTLYEYKETSNWVNRSYQVLDELHKSMLEVYALESEQRGYIIADDEIYLEGTEISLERVRSMLIALGQLTTDNPEQQLRITALSQLVEERLQLLSQNVAVYRAEGFAAVRNHLRTANSLQVMEKLQKLAAIFEADERDLLKQRVELSESGAYQAQLVGALFVGFAFIGLIVLWWRIRREAQARQEVDVLGHESDLLKQILDLLPVGVFVTDTAGNFTQINAAARAIWNGERKGGISQYGDYAGWWPDTDKRLEADDWALARALKTGEIIRDELIDIRCFDGIRKTIASHAMPIRDEAGNTISALAVHVDVTEFRRKEQQVRATARFDETHGLAVTLFASSFDRSRILEGFLKLLAERHPLPVSALYSFDEWSGNFHCQASHGLSGAIPREFAPGEGLLGQAAQDGKSTLLDCAQLTLQTGLAEFEPAQVLMIPVGYQGRRLAVLVVAASERLEAGDRLFFERLAITLGVALDNLRQYSDLKLLAEQLRASGEEIAVKNRQLEDASSMKSEFLANMSHELRTPLNAVIGFSEMLKDELLGELAPQQKEYINDIFTSGTHLLSLINDILDLSKVEAGKMTLELEPVQPDALVQASLQVVREKAMAHRIHLVTEVADGLDELGDIWLDERKAKQILYNLLSNAVKFTLDGGEVRIQARRVSRDAVPQGFFEYYLELSVTDTGIGISEENQLKLFQPFTQIDSKLARRYEGTGLGLVMVKRLSELHGGAVAMQSVPEQGSTFTVWLPWRIETDSSLPSVQPDQMDTRRDLVVLAPTQSLNQPLALVVEDDDKAAELLRLQLENNGFRVVRASTAESAMKFAAQERPDLLTLDIQLPGMDGWEFLERFKQQEQFAGVPVVVVSIVADKSRGLSLGASQVLQKPVSREVFSRALATLGFLVGAVHHKGQRTILVIDDDPKAVQLISAYLNPAGYRVLSAFGGQEGLDVARREHPDLIVLDLMMPEIDGFEVVEALKGDASTADIPIVIITAKQITAEDRAALSGDVRKVLQKSEFKQGSFITEVERAMAGKGK